MAQRDEYAGSVGIGQKFLVEQRSVRSYLEMEHLPGFRFDFAAVSDGLGYKVALQEGFTPEKYDAQALIRRLFGVHSHRNSRLDGIECHITAKMRRSVAVAAPEVAARR
jgi:hypothetical protein